MFKKILLSPINAFKWISYNPAESMLFFVFLISILPFVTTVGSTALGGGLMAFLACIGEKFIFKYEKPTKLYSIVCIIILIMGIIALFRIGEKDYQSHWTTGEQFFATYEGAFFGILMGSMFVSFIEQERDEKRKKREVERKYEEMKAQEKTIAEKEREGLVVIRRFGKPVGYIEKEKYEKFVDENIKNI